MGRLLHPKRAFVVGLVALAAVLGSGSAATASTPDPSECQRSIEEGLPSRSAETSECREFAAAAASWGLGDPQASYACPGHSGIGFGVICDGPTPGSPIKKCAVVIGTSGYGCRNWS